MAPVGGIQDKRREDEDGDAIHRNGLEAGEAGGNQEDILFLDIQGGSTDPSLEDVMGQEKTSFTKICFSIFIIT